MSTARAGSASFDSIDASRDLHTTRHCLRLRGGSLLESVLADPRVELRARQPKPPRGFRFVSSAFVQDLRDRRAFERAQIRRVVARCPGGWLQAKWFTSMSAPSLRIVARSRTLRSSRTFPGQSY